MSDFQPIQLELHREALPELLIRDSLNADDGAKHLLKQVLSFLPIDALPLLNKPALERIESVFHLQILAFPPVL